MQDSLSLLQETLGMAVLPSVQCYTDNRSLTRELQTLLVTKKLRVDITRLRSMVSEGKNKGILDGWMVNYIW